MPDIPPAVLTKEDRLQLAEEKCGVVLAGDPAMEAIATQLYNFRNSRLIHTLVGQPGVGKEGLAKYVNAVSTRGGNFFAVNIAGLSESLIESELFGHELGSFSGAAKKRQGRFELIAKKGTLFLDEVGELSPLKQATILRATSDDPKITPVGANEEIGVEGRIVCATNADLEAGVRAGKFRQDLRERLEACMIYVPPFEKRHEDHRVKVIEALAKRFRTESGMNELALTDSGMDFLLHTPIRGNVRGVKNLLERVTYTAQGNGLADIDADLLRTVMTEQSHTNGHSGPAEYPKDSLSLHIPFSDEARGGLSPLHYARKRMAEQAVALKNGNQTRAAAMLEISTQTLRNWMDVGRKEEGGQETTVVSSATEE